MQERIRGDDVDFGKDDQQVEKEEMITDDDVE